jgi:membrane protease YdiL (CAAX protease family)
MPAAETTGKGRAIKLATILLLVLIDLPFGGWIAPGHGLASLVAREGVYWAITVLLLIFVVTAERRPLSSIGLRVPTWKTFVVGLGAGLLMTAIIAVIYLVIYPLAHVPVDIGKGTPTAALPYWLNVAIVCRAAVFEEVFYRGFAIERLAELTGSRYLAAAISLVAFTLAHLSAWGWMHLLVAGAGGVVLTVLYLLRRDLACNMLAHFVTDGIGFLL